MEDQKAVARKGHAHVLHEPVPLLKTPDVGVGRRGREIEWDFGECLVGFLGGGGRVALVGDANVSLTIQKT